MSDVLFCPFRKIWVAALPEERIRQALLQEMTQKLGYPMGSLALEKSLDQLPHLQNTASLPRRRADLIVFAKNLHPQHAFYPLLLVECKAVSLTNKVLRQIIGYNQFVGAPFIAAVNQNHTLLGWHHPDYKDFRFQDRLLSYEILLNWVHPSSDSSVLR